MMRRLKTQRAPQRSHGIPSITRLSDSSPQTKIILFAQTRRNSREIRRSPPFINSPSRRGKVLLPRVLSSLENYRFPTLGRRARRSQQIEKQRQSNRDEIRAGPLICHEKPRESVRKIRFNRIRQRPISENEQRENRDGPSVLSLPLSYIS